MSKESGISCLRRADRRSWLAWRKANPDLDLSDLDLRSIFQNYNWSDWPLNGVNFSRSDLRQIDLRDADLSGANFAFADLSGARLDDANLSKANFFEATLIRTEFPRAIMPRAQFVGAFTYQPKFGGADLRYANLIELNLAWADFREANLQGAKLSFADLSNADLAGADLSEATLWGARLTRANLAGATLVHTNIYEVSVWETYGNPKRMTDLVASTPGISDEPEFTVDNLLIAQSIYLLRENKNIKEFVDSIAGKVVLILGRFSHPGTKQVLDSIKERLRRDYVPVLFDFQGPNHKTMIEAISLLADISTFVLADFTYPKLVLQEVRKIVANPSIPVKPLFMRGAGEVPVVLTRLREEGLVLEIYFYEDGQNLIGSFDCLLVETRKEIAHTVAKERDWIGLAESERREGLIRQIYGSSMV